MPASPNYRVIIFAASQRDADVTSLLLAKYGIESTACTQISRTVSKMREGVGALIIAKEALNAEALALLSDELKKQPAWSSIPIILLISAGDLTEASERTLKFLSPLG